MKTLKTIFTLLSIAIFTVSCSSDDDKDSPKYNVENPLAAYYTTTGFSTVSNFVNSGDYEFGLAFTPTVKGKIKAITLNCQQQILQFESRSGTIQLKQFCALRL